MVITMPAIDDWPPDLAGQRVQVVNPLRAHWSIKFCAEAALRAFHAGASVAWADAPLLFGGRQARLLEVNSSDEWRWWAYSCPLVEVRRVLANAGIPCVDLPSIPVEECQIPQSLEELDAWSWRGYDLGFVLHAAVSGKLYRRSIDLTDPGTFKIVVEMSRMATLLCASLEEQLSQSRPDLVITTNDRTLPAAVTLLVARRLGIDTRVVYWGSQIDSIMTYKTSLYSQADRRSHVEKGWERVCSSKSAHSLAVRRAVDWQSQAAEMPGTLDFSSQMRVGMLPPRAARRRCVFFSSSPWEFSGVKDLSSEGFTSQYEALQALIGLLPEDEWEIVLRHHPSHPTLGDVSEPESWANVPGIERVTQIKGDSPVDSMELARGSDLCAVWVSSIGVRIAAIPKPVLVMGPAYWSGKGLGLPAVDEKSLRSLQLLSSPHLSIERLAAVLTYLSDQGIKMKFTTGLGPDTRVLGHRVFSERHLLVAAMRRSVLLRKIRASSLVRRLPT